MSQMMANCPHCGGYLHVGIGERSFVCEYCRKRVMLADLGNFGTSKSTSQKNKNGEYTAAFDKNALPTLEISNIYEKIDLAFAICEWGLVKEYCSELIRRDPTNSQAYFFALLADCKVYDKTGLINAERPLDENPNFQYLLSFSDDSLREELLRCNEQVRVRFEAEEKEKLYANAWARLVYAASEKDCMNAANIFESLGNYRDSQSKYQECYEKAEKIKMKNIFNKGIKIFAVIMIFLIMFSCSIRDNL